MEEYHLEIYDSLGTFLNKAVSIPLERDEQNCAAVLRPYPALIHRHQDRKSRPVRGTGRLKANAFTRAHETRGPLRGDDAGQTPDISERCRDA